MVPIQFSFSLYLPESSIQVQAKSIQWKTIGISAVEVEIKPFVVVIQWILDITARSMRVLKMG